MQPDKETVQPEQAAPEPAATTLPALTSAASTETPAAETGEPAKSAAPAPEATAAPADASGAPEPAAQAPAAQAPTTKAPDIAVEAKAEASPDRPHAPRRPWSPKAWASKAWTPKNWKPTRPGWMPGSGAAKPAETAKTPASRSNSRFPLLAASVALAACIGAAAGAAGVAGIGHLTTRPASTPQPVATAPASRSDAEIKALRDAVAQLRGQVRSMSEGIAALRSSAEGTGRSTQAQMAKLADTVERLEKAQAEPFARLTKLTAAVERIERREAATPTSDITGSVRQASAAAPAQALQLPAKPGMQLPQRDTRQPRAVVEGWRLHEVQRGVALVEGRVGLAEVMVGDTLRGVGRVQDIRREDGRWVVVTSRGLILPAR